MTLDIILHIARTPQKQQPGDPQCQSSQLAAPGLQVAHREADKGQHHRAQAKHLHHADKTVGPEEVRIRPGRIQHRLAPAIVQAEQPEDIPGAAVILPFPCEKKHEQNQEDYPGGGRLQHKGVQSVFRRAGGRADHLAAQQRAFRQNAAPVRTVRKASQSSQGDGSGTCQAHGIQHGPQMPPAAKRRQQQRRQENARKGSGQQETAPAVVRQSLAKTFKAAGPEMPVGKSGKHHAEPQTQRHRTEAAYGIGLVPEIEEQEQQQPHGAGHGQNCRAPINHIRAPDKRDLLHGHFSFGLAVPK